MDRVKLFLFATLFLCWTSQALSQSADNDTQCFSIPTGELEFTARVRGVPGPEGPRGEKGDKGIIGPRGLKGDTGLQGKKGDRGDTGPTGPQGQKGKEGSKGQKGSRGLQGLHGPTGGAGVPGAVGQRGARGPEGPEGERGPQGVPGPAGPPGLQGPEGDTILSPEELNKVLHVMEENVSSHLDSVLQELHSNFSNDLTLVKEHCQKELVDLHNVMITQKSSTNVKCGIYSTKWRRVAHIDMTDHTARCPSGLREVSNTMTKQRACGRSVSRGCSSLVFNTSGNYTSVCGQVRGYQFREIEAINGGSIDTHYAEGVLITNGSPRRHLWTYAVGRSETHRWGCPCSTGGSTSRQNIPAFVGSDYYCESGFVNNYENRIAWKDPLWDGAGCVTPGNTCCQRYGWFHKQVQQTSDSIEVRWCASVSTSSEDVVTDIVEIWVQ